MRPKFDAKSLWLSAWKSLIIIAVLSGVVACSSDRDADTAVQELNIVLFSMPYTRGLAELKDDSGHKDMKQYLLNEILKWRIQSSRKTQGFSCELSACS